MLFIVTPALAWFDMEVQLSIYLDVRTFVLCPSTPTLSYIMFILKVKSVNRKP